MICINATAVFLNGCSCRVERSVREQEELRKQMQLAVEMQGQRENARKHAWAEIEKRFDVDRNGQIGPQERSAMNAFLENVKAGKVVSPFPD